MNIGTVAVIGSILAGLVSLPAVSASITGDITAAGAEISGVSEQGFNETPRTVAEKVTADSMRKTVETAFGRITFRSTSDGFAAELENPRHSLHVNRSPGEEMVEFTAGSAELHVKETPARVDEVCKTPRGTLEKVSEDGGETVRFSGTGREEVRADCADARSMMDEQLDKVRSVSVDLGLTLPDIAVTRVNSSKEAVTITNNGGNEVELDGWTLSDDGGTTFAGFDGVVLAPGNTVTVYSEQDLDIEDCEESGGPDHERCWDASFVWNDDGETAVLANAQGETVDTHTYD